MSRFLRFLLCLVPISCSFALTPQNLHKTVDEVKKELHLTEWNVIARSLSTHDMQVTQGCKCYGESMIFPETKIDVVTILDDSAYKDMGWTDLDAIHAHQRFVVLHELLHVSVQLTFPDMSHGEQEANVEATSKMIADEPEKR
jgi:hypothetical protein